MTSFSHKRRRLQKDLPLMVAPETAMDEHSGKGYILNMIRTRKIFSLIYYIV